MVKPQFTSFGRKGKEKINKEKEKFPEKVKKIIQESDILLEILDARFPEETRNKEMENMIRKQGKKIIYVLNKADLLKSEKRCATASSNEQFFQRSFLGVRNSPPCDFQRISKSKIESSLNPSIFFSSKKRFGSRILRNLIKKQAREMEKDKINVGIVGYPNTGKSSIANILIGKKSAGLSQQAGFTKGVQKLKLMRGIYLLDSPGVIPEKEYSIPNRIFLNKHVEIGVRTYDKIKEPEIAVASLMKKYPNIIEEFYQIEANGDSEIFING